MFASMYVGGGNLIGPAGGAACPPVGAALSYQAGVSEQDNDPRREIFSRRNEKHRPSKCPCAVAEAIRLKWRRFASVNKPNSLCAVPAVPSPAA
jgi:hypothetical protein